ncbi:MAG: pyruvate kinase, partial [Halomonas sp.]|nr:pyruvate kinase [Halomonas sp.]
MTHRPTPLRRTKIVATLGPASDREGVLEAMLAAGVDVVRLNFSHGTAEDHRQRLARVREIAARLGRSVAALGDLQGPK